MKKSACDRLDAVPSMTQQPLRTNLQEFVVDELLVLRNETEEHIPDLLVVSRGVMASKAPRRMSSLREWAGKANYDEFLHSKLHSVGPLNVQANSLKDVFVMNTTKRIVIRLDADSTPCNPYTQRHTSDRVPSLMEGRGLKRLARSPGLASLLFTLWHSLLSLLVLHRLYPLIRFVCD